MHYNLIPDNIDWDEYRRETEAQTRVRPASAFLGAMIDRIGKKEAKKPVAYLPWTKTHKLLQFRGGEVTLWAGYSGHGKSAVLGEVITSMLIQAWKAAIASLEMKPEISLDRMVQQFAGLETDLEDVPTELVDVTRDVYEQFQALCDARLWFYDQQGTVDVDRIVAVVRYCFKELGIKQMVVDSLMKCVKHDDDYNGQKLIVDELTALARDYDAHVHLVHHMRKGNSELNEPDKNDVKGAGSIVDQIDNLIIVHRNKQKEIDAERGKLVLPDTPDTLLLVRKQRNGTGWEGAIKLFFDRASKQYTATPGAFLDMAAWPHSELNRR